MLIKIINEWIDRQISFILDADSEPEDEKIPESCLCPTIIFYNHNYIKLTIDSGATGKMTRGSTAMRIDA